LRPTKSKVLYAQIIGRSTRTVPGLIDGLDTVPARLAAIAGSSKPRAYVIDPLWLSDDHDLVTPAFMIADSKEEAIEMQKMAGASYSLRDIQAQREEVIRRRLEATSRFREGKITAEYFAAATGDHALLHWEPAFKWEQWPVTTFTSRLLSTCGIDTSSVETEGFAQAVKRAVYKRRSQGLPEIHALADVAGVRGLNDPSLWTITKRELVRL
jgi:hypothetical protein